MTPVQVRFCDALSPVSPSVGVGVVAPPWQMNPGSQLPDGAAKLAMLQNFPAGHLVH